MPVVRVRITFKRLQANQRKAFFSLDKMNSAGFDPAINCARADLAKLRRFIRRDHLYLRVTDFAPGDGRMISLIQHNQPVLLDGDLDSPFRMVYRLPNVLLLPGRGNLLSDCSLWSPWDKISTASIRPTIPLVSTSGPTLRGGS
jgi:hypothetical protein